MSLTAKQGFLNRTTLIMYGGITLGKPWFTGDTFKKMTILGY
jgi:hypothetical protein